MSQEDLKNKIASDFSSYNDNDVSKNSILNDLEDAQIIFYEYETGSYDGDALCIYQKDNNFYIVEAGHCSCYGLEDQWRPDKTTWEALIKMCTNSSWGMFHDNKSKIMEKLQCKH